MSVAPAITGKTVLGSDLKTYSQCLRHLLVTGKEDSLRRFHGN